MSANRFFCTFCGSAMTPAEDVVSRFAECPNCQHIVPVPALSDGVPGDDLGALPEGVLALEVKFRCSSCRVKLQIDARWEGRVIICPRCDQPTAVPQWSSRPPPSVNLSPAEVALLTGTIETAGRAGTA